MDTTRDILFNHAHRLISRRGVLRDGDPTLADLLDHENKRVIVFIDNALCNTHPDIETNLRKKIDPSRLTGVHTVLGGERCKNDHDIWRDIARSIAGSRIDRHSYVLTIGGGAVLDAVGFAASTVHRGVRQVRMGTTTLAQADSAVGVKCAVNLDGAKNMLGCFAVPVAVINDYDLLTTLDDTHWRAGFAEAIKVAVIQDASLFESIERNAGRIVARDAEISESVVTRSARLHYDHITLGGDPFEKGSSRPLDMGHWSAHQLESMTGYELPHGEAVAIGLAIDAVYAARLGVLRDTDARRIISALSALGFALSHPAMEDTARLLHGLESFREHLGGALTLILPAGIGQTATVHTVDEQMMIDAIRRVADGATQAV